MLTDQTVWNERRLLVERLGGWMGETLTLLKQRHQADFETPVPLNALNGKITKGDHYNGFPYMLLDYPNHFSKNEIVAVRNLISFGNGFYSTMHLRGHVVNDALPRIAKINSTKAFVCTAHDEWLHHIDAQHWISVNDFSSSHHDQIKTQGWLKLGVQLEINEPETWTNALVEAYDIWSGVLSNL